jgi:DNA phosphorothioation-dependent restriction protein DptG
MVDSVTARWVRNASDELAIARGCRFDERRGQHVIDFFERFLKLYKTGKPICL